MADNIEDAEWEEIPGNNGNLSKLTGPAPDFKGAQTQASAPTAKSALGGWWTDMPMLGKAILIVFGLSFLPSFCSSDPSAPSSGTQTAQSDTAAVAQPTQESAADAATVPKNPLNSLLLGIWVSARTGGEDGQTDCALGIMNDSFIRRQRGSISLLNYEETGRFRQIFVQFNEDVQAVTEGTWTLSDDIISLSFDNAAIGKLSDDIDNLPGKPDLSGEPTVMRVRFDGPNVFHQSNIETGVTNRFVRCRM